jgi:signal transduction histidine kinase
MTTRASFQTRARAIDHLGRGQIADCPTAVTELWKNAYDAYARNVSLHIFAGSPDIAAIFDDGCGMTRSDIESRWLVIGTESKADGRDVPAPDRFGLPIRPRMGEKGIGRLSAGFLAPLSVLISKKLNSDFAAVIVDWRLFENPYLLISDILLPIEEFGSLDDFPGRISEMLGTIRRNLTGESRESTEDASRIQEAWDRFSCQERDAGAVSTTAQKISALADICNIPSDILSPWPVANGTSDHGTALLLIEPQRELSVWVGPKIAEEDVEAKQNTNQLKMTLVGFADPDAENMRDFSYFFEVHRTSTRRIVLDETHQIDTEWLRSLEHYIEGHFNGAGWFEGTAKAFGRDLGQFRVPPTVPELMDKKGISRVGPFAFRVGTFEQDPKNSTLPDEAYEAFLNVMNEFSGLMVYRDGVRVLPYGRPESDFFGVEERRGKNAGREFWAHRRSFGRVNLTRNENPDLKDKAGREGLVDNRARRLMKELVVGVFKYTARAFFGSASQIRQEVLPELQARYKRAKASQEKARKQRKKYFLLQLPRVIQAIADIQPKVENLAIAMESSKEHRTIDQLEDLQANVHTMEAILKSIRLPTIPHGLEDKAATYREIRDQRESLARQLGELDRIISEKLYALLTRTPSQIIEEARIRYVSIFRSQLKKDIKSFQQLLSNLENKWQNDLKTAEEQFNLDASEVIATVGNGNSADWGLGRLAELYDSASSTVFGYLSSVMDAIKLLIDDVDVEGALTLSDEEQLSANEKLAQMSLLAQTGVVVELIGHELEEMSGEAEANLNRLPAICKQSPQYGRAQNAFLALITRLRFLSPLSVVTYRSRRSITGAEIAIYLREFFSQRFVNSDVSFQVTQAFDNISITDVPSRIFPVFINLVNNSLYWVQLVKERTVRLDFQNGLVIVADSGPGVDAEDIANLFELFFTQRPQGRGIGLYLCRVNLAIARHSIRYSQVDDPRILPGANFIISFQGLQIQQPSGD